MDFALLLEVLLSVPKTLLFNFKNFPLKQALRFPVLVNRRTKIKSMSGEIVLPETIMFGLVKIGFSGSYNLGGENYFENRGKIIINGKATFSRGIQLIVGEKGCLEIGSNFRCNANCIINAGSRIKMGDDCLLAWNIMILDGDGHDIYLQNGTYNENISNIFIGTHVWICANSTILKGALISDNSVVGAGTIVSKKFEHRNVLIAGKNKIVKENVNWKD